MEDLLVLRTESELLMLSLVGYPVLPKSCIDRCSESPVCLVGVASSMLVFEVGCLIARLWSLLAYLDETSTRRVELQTHLHDITPPFLAMLSCSCRGDSILFGYACCPGAKEVGSATAMMKSALIRST